MSGWRKLYFSFLPIGLSFLFAFSQNAMGIENPIYLVEDPGGYASLAVLCRGKNVTLEQATSSRGVCIQFIERHLNPFLSPESVGIRDLVPASRVKLFYGDGYDASPFKSRGMGVVGEFGEFIELEILGHFEHASVVAVSHAEFAAAESGRTTELNYYVIPFHHLKVALSGARRTAPDPKDRVFNSYFYLTSPVYFRGKVLDRDSLLKVPGLRPLLPFSEFRQVFHQYFHEAIWDPEPVSPSGFLGCAKRLWHWALGF